MIVDYIENMLMFVVPNSFNDVFSNRSLLSNGRHTGESPETFQPITETVRRDRPIHLFQILNFMPNSVATRTTSALGNSIEQIRVNDSAEIRESLRMMLNSYLIFSDDAPEDKQLMHEHYQIVDNLVRNIQIMEG